MGTEKLVELSDEDREMLADSGWKIYGRESWYTTRLVHTDGYEVIGGTAIEYFLVGLRADYEPMYGLSDLLKTLGQVLDERGVVKPVITTTQRSPR